MKKTRVCLWASMRCRTERGVPGGIPAPRPHRAMGCPALGLGGGGGFAHLVDFSVPRKKKREGIFGFKGDVT